MADIEQYLREILQAVYGEEVRGSIHDAIEAMNNDIYDNTVEVKGYAESAKQSATNSEASAQRAATSASSASTSASQASSSASSASTSASQASSSATEAKSWAVGGTSSRADENTDNAKYYSDEAKRAANGISGALTARGTITFSELQEKTSKMSADTVGYMYNISTDFTTDSTFMEGSGIPYKAGTNVYWCAAQKWDCLAAGTISPEQFDGVLPVSKGGTGNQIGQALSLPNWQCKKITINELNDPDTTGGVYSIEDEGLISGAGAHYYVIRTSGYTVVGHSYYRDIALPYEWNKQYPNNAIYTRFWKEATPGEWFRIPVASELPTKTSDLTNDSGFITSAQIPEGAAASNTVPKAPEATGSVGSEMAFARGDHVHPYGDRIADSSNTPYGSGIQFAYGGNVDELFTGAVYPVLAGKKKSSNAPMFGSVTKRFYKQSIGYAEISDITDSNFTGVLPVEKGGTGNNDGMIPVRHGNEIRFDKDGSKSNQNLEIGYTTGWKTYAFRDGTGPNGAKIICGPITSPSIPSIATATTAGLVKPGTGLSITGDGTLNVTSSGSESKLYMTEFHGFENASHQVYIHIPTQSTDLNVSFLKKFISTMAKHSYPALGAYGTGHSVYAVMASLNGEDRICIRTDKDEVEIVYDELTWTITSYPLFG